MRWDVTSRHSHCPSVVTTTVMTEATRGTCGPVWESHVHPTEVDVQDTVISIAGQGSIPFVPRVVGAQAEVETQAGAVEVFAVSDCSHTESCGDAAEHGSRTIRRIYNWSTTPTMGGWLSERREVQDSHDRRVVRVSRQVQR